MVRDEYITGTGIIYIHKPSHGTESDRERGRDNDREIEIMTDGEREIGRERYVLSLRESTREK